MFLNKGSLHEVKEKKCSVCSQLFECGMTESDGTCWCNQFPPIFDINSESDCLCPACLKKITLHKINDYINNLSVNGILNNKAKDLPPAKKLIEDVDFYIEKENYVFTTWYHLKRGYCCQNGCRHCPYGCNK
jgi:hypothetical protein